jgi:hypothetical protein
MPGHAVLTEEKLREIISLANRGLSRRAISAADQSAANGRRGCSYCSTGAPTRPIEPLNMNRSASNRSALHRSTANRSI